MSSPFGPDFSTLAPALSATPNPAIHTAPPGPQPSLPYTPQQLLELGAQWIEGFVRRVALAVLGAIPGGAEAFELLSEWAANTNSTLSNAWTGLNSLLNDLWTNPAAVIASIPQALVTGLVGIAATATNAFNGLGALITQVGGAVIDDVAAAINGAVAGVAGTINAIVAGFTGLIGSWTTGDAQAAAANLAAQQAEIAASVAALQQQSDIAAQAGKSAFVDFSLRADADSLGSDFDQTYSGAGDDWYGVTSGRAATRINTISAGRRGWATYNVFSTNGDYQQVSAVFASSPQVTTYGQPFTPVTIYGYNALRCRVASTGPYAGIDCVMVVFDQAGFNLGCVVNGVWTNWARVNRAFDPGAIYWLRAGTVAGLRQYYVGINKGTLLIHTEVGTASQVGADYRRGGVFGEWSVGVDGFGTKFAAYPGLVAALSVQDAAPPTILGSYGKVYRASSAIGVNLGVGAGIIAPPNFFDTVYALTSDLQWTSSASAFTVTKKGRYLVSCTLTCDSTASRGTVGIMVNGGITGIGAEGWASHVSQALNLFPGDYIQFIYTATTAVRLIGMANGSIAWFSIAKLTEDVPNVT